MYLKHNCIYQTIEKQYPTYPTISSIVLSEPEKEQWLDVRPYMDASYYVIKQSASVMRAHRHFRNMGMRHLVVIDGENKVVGIITRKDLLDKTLRSLWKKEIIALEQNINVEAIPPGIIYDFTKPAAPNIASIPMKLQPEATEPISNMHDSKSDEQTLSMNQFCNNDKE